MKTTMEPNTTFMHQLNDGGGATVDTRLVPIVKTLNRLGVKTVRSFLDIDIAEVTFTGTKYETMSDLLFNHIGTMTAHLGWVHLELTYDTLTGFVGTIEVRSEDLDDFSSRFLVWFEMMHK